MNEGPRPRREFLLTAGALASGVTPAALARGGQDPPEEPMISHLTFIEAERLAGIEFNESERNMLVESIDGQLDRLRDKTLGELPLELAPSLTFDPRLPGRPAGPDADRIEPRRVEPGPLPERDEDIAFASVGALGAWLRGGGLTSERLTTIYLDRLERIGPRLECVVTLTPELAMEQARRADRELSAGQSRGPLHGIPWGAKDLFDTAGIRTTFGAAPYRLRVPETDAAAVARLRDAGAVLVAKLTLGALAYGDRWYAGKTRNPWNLEQGSSGSSAGSAAAVAAGLVGFALGTETYGSIVSPAVRCGATGLRPTFGRVPRTGAMPLCWSLDKVGPIARRSEDCAVILDAIRGSDPGDPASTDVPMSYVATAPVRGLRVGYVPSWFEGGQRRGDDERAANANRVLELARELGAEVREIELPEWPYATLLTMLFAEAAAAFEHLTRDGRDAELVWQEAEAWPNSFRQAWFIPAIEYVQVDRFRRRVMNMMASVFDDVDVLLSPPFAGSLLLITNHTGHPCLTLRTGFDRRGRPLSMTLWGRLYDEGALTRLGTALEDRLDVWSKRPRL